MLFSPTILGIATLSYRSRPVLEHCGSIHHLLVPVVFLSEVIGIGTFASITSLYLVFLFPRSSAYVQSHVL